MGGLCVSVRVEGSVCESCHDGGFPEQDVNRLVPVPTNAAYRKGPPCHQCRH